jgi:replicative DNA helicase
MTLQSLDKYGFSFQVKVIASLLTDKIFLTNINDSLDIEYFSNQSHKWVIQQILQYYSKYNTFPTMEILKIELKKIDNEVLQIAVKEQLKEAYVASEQDLRYIKEEFLNFCKNQKLKNALLGSVDLLRANDYDSIRTLINNALKAGQDQNIGMEYEKDIESRYRENSRKEIPFPWKTLNNITQGGYGKGDLVLIFGNPGGGKSWSLISMAAEAAKSGKNVVYYTLELDDTYIGKRLDAYFTGIPVDKIDKHRKEVEQAMENIPGKIIVMGYPPKKASLITVEKHLEQLKNNHDFEADVVFIDYLDLLKNRGSRKERKDDIDDVYTEAKGLAKELEIPIVSPSQANRSGTGKSILEGEHIAGSFDKLMIGDIVISLARTRKDKLQGTGRWHIMKNRYGPDGMSYLSSIDTTTGKIEIDEEQIDIEDEKDFNENKKSNSYSNINNDEKDFLKRKFFELETNT